MAQNFSLGFWQCSEFDFIMTSCVYLRRSLHHPIAHCEKQQGTERKKTENIFCQILDENNSMSESRAAEKGKNVTERRERGFSIINLSSSSSSSSS